MKNSCYLSFNSLKQFRFRRSILIGYFQIFKTLGAGVQFISNAVIQIIKHSEVCVHLNSQSVVHIMWKSTPDAKYTQKYKWSEIQCLFQGESDIQINWKLARWPKRNQLAKWSESRRNVQSGRLHRSVEFQSPIWERRGHVGYGFRAQAAWFFFDFFGNWEGDIFIRNMPFFRLLTALCGVQIGVNSVPAEPLPHRIQWY